MFFKFRKLFVVLLILFLSQSVAFSQTLKIIVGYSAGGPVDTTARQFAPYLSKELGHTVIVENKPGVTGVLGAVDVARAAPGTNLLYFAASPTITITPHVVKNLPANLSNELTPISPILSFSNVLVVNKDAPFKSVKELISYAKLNPGKITYGSSGMGATNHLSGELLEQRTNIKMSHVPYKGNAPAMMDVIGGQITMMFDITGSAQNFINSGKVRALAVTSRDRNSSMPNIPTMKESGVVDYEVGGWYALFGPANISPDLVDRYNKAVRNVLDNPEFRNKLVDGGYEIWIGSPKELTERIQRESLLWSNVTKHLKFD